MQRRRGHVSRRELVVGAGAATFLAGCGRLPWQAEQPPKVHRIGWLGPTGIPVDTFLQGLLERGYIEGHTFTIESASAERADAYPSLVADFVQRTVDVIVAVGNPAIRAAKDATTSIPVVMVLSRDPVGTGLVTSLAQPGGNLTGVSLLSPQLNGKRLELLAAAVPAISRVGILWEGIYPDRQNDLSELQAAALTLGLGLVLLDVREPSDLESAFESASRERADALMVFATPTTRQADRIATLAATSRLPAIYDRELYVRAGGLMSYGPSDLDHYRRSAYYVDRILKGTNPADLPIEQPMTFEFAVNLKTARELGLTFPNEIMLQVTEVIQ
jgi:putative tryptophan/tyrosine transport system substrate-binding protein